LALSFKFLSTIQSTLSMCNWLIALFYFLLVTGVLNSGCFAC
jgi:hypothetical protein